MIPDPSPANSNTEPGDFTNQADAYNASRPSYPETLLDLIFEEIKLAPYAHVADIGAGTGIFTAQLADRGFNVSAVEPNLAMSGKAAPHPNTHWVEGTFEQTNLPDSSQDWAVAAQAFHWAEPEAALPEIHRILKPGGRFTVIWNNRLNDDEPTLSRIWALIKSTVPGFDDAYRDNRDWPTILVSTGHFSDVTFHEQRHVIDMPRERFVNLWRSHNHLTTSAGPTLIEQLLNGIKRDLNRHGIKSVPVPYLCRAWTVKRKD